MDMMTHPPSQVQRNKDDRHCADDHYCNDDNHGNDDKHSNDDKRCNDVEPIREEVEGQAAGEVGVDIGG